MSDTDKTRVLFTPNWAKNNPYQQMLADSVSDTCQVNMANYPSGLRPFSQLITQYPDTQVIHLHWITELIQRLSWSKPQLIFQFKLLLISFDLWRVKRKGVKVVWTIHNKLSHQGLNQSREIAVRKRFIKLVDRVILHSQEALNAVEEFYSLKFADKTSIIYHGNYENHYPTPAKIRTQLRQDYKLNDKTTHILYFGSIRPYKGVEILIEAFSKLADKSRHKLTIAGGVPRAEYKASLNAKLQSVDGINAMLDFLPEQTLSDVLTTADIVVIPFVDTLTSGSTILAMTQGKALALPYAARIFGCVPEEGVYYFENTEQLSEILKSTNIETLSRMGESNRLQAQKMSWDKVGQLTTLTYLTNH